MNLVNEEPREVIGRHRLDDSAGRPHGSATKSQMLGNLVVLSLTCHAVYHAARCS